MVNSGQNPLYSRNFFLLCLFLNVFISNSQIRVPVNTISITGTGDLRQQENSVNTAGDLNGDGIADLVIGSYYLSPIVYIVWGPLTGISNLDVSTMTPDQGFKITGTDYIGMGVKNGGDINNDGIDDLLIGWPFDSPLGRSYAGSCYVIYGKTTGFSDFDISSFTNDQGFRIFGEANYDFSSYSVSYAGDFNHDGIDDIIVGGQTASPSVGFGHAYVIFGKSTGFSDIDLTALTIDQGIRITGEVAIDLLGYSVSNAGDFNNDGVDDVVVGASVADISATDSGCAYVIFGKKEGLNNINLASLTSSQGIRIIGEAASDMAGSAVNYAGDVNGDTIDDVIIGAPGASKAYIIFGQSTGLSDISLSALTSSQGFRIIGVPGEKFGTSVSYARDMSGDGIDDVIIGAPEADQTSPTALTDAGAAYVIYGKTSGIADITASDVASDYTLGFVSLGNTASGYYGQSVGYTGNIDGTSSHSVAIRGKLPDATGPVTILTGASYYIYWDYTHLATCNPPLQVQTYYGVTFCIDPCDNLDNPYLYWDGSCQSSCEFPLSSRVFKNRYFCDFPCLNTEYLYPDGTCSDICTLPVELIIEGSKKICTTPIVETTSVSITVVQDAGLINQIAQIALSFLSFDSSSMTITSVMLKKLEFVRYLAIRNTTRLVDLYNNSDPSPDCLDIAPDIPLNVQNDYPPLSFEFNRYDVQASFLINYWRALISIPILLGICIFLRILDFVFKKYPIRRTIKAFLSQLNIIMQNFTLQQFYSTFPDITLFAIFEFQGQLSGSFSLNFSFLMAIIWPVIGIGLLIFHFILIRRFQKLKATVSNKSENKKALRNFVLKNAGFTILFEDFHHESFFTQACLLILLLRAIVFSSVVGLLYNYPFVQIMIFIAMGIPMLIFLLRNKPHRKSPDLWQEIAFEIIVLLVDFCLLILNLQDVAGTPYNQVQYDLAEIILYCNIIGRFVPLICIIVRLLLVIYNRKKSGKEWSIKALVNEFLDIFIPNPQEDEEKDNNEIERITGVNLRKKSLQSKIELKYEHPLRVKQISKIIPVSDEDTYQQTPTDLTLGIQKNHNSMSLFLTPVASSTISQHDQDTKSLLRSKIAIQFSPAKLENTEGNLITKEFSYTPRDLSKLIDQNPGSALDTSSPTIKIQRA